MPQDLPFGWLADTSEKYSDFIDHWGRTAPDQVAIENSNQTLTYGEIARDVDRLATHLAQQGLRPRDRLFIVGENAVGTVLLVFAANRVGASISVVNARMKTSEIKVLRDFADPRLTAFVAQGSDVTGDHARALGASVIDLETLGGEIWLGSVNDASEQNEDRGATKDQIALIMFTSGTTGTPKGVMLTNATMLAQAQSQNRARSLGPDDRLYVVAPMSHQIGLSGSVISSTCAGCRMILPLRHDPDYLARKLAAGDVTIVVGVPQLYNGLLAYAASKGITFEKSRLRLAGSGGAPLDPALKERVRDVLGVTLANGYGATEFVPVCRVPPGADVASNVVGKLEPGVECRIVDDDGTDLPDGTSGEIWVRGPFMMVGYFRNPDATAEVMRPGGWLATGDIGMIENGMIAITGRKKEIIIRSGFNVYPTDVEAALTEYPDVNMAAVLGRRVENNEEIVAFVTAMPDRTIDPDALRDFTRKTLTAYKVPTEVVVLDEMPIGPTGKILKTALKDRL